MKGNRIRQFNRLTFITLIVVYLVILAGGIVRSTGSGMGCPDWPKCFGSWVPPTQMDQLPADYQESFAALRVKKNQRLAEYLKFLGFNNLAVQIQDESIAAPEAVFNATKTWIEYINRLLGVLLGFLIILLTVFSVRLRQVAPTVFYGSILALILVVFQGWLGSVVVSTNLLPGLITAHMALAALLIGVLIYLYHTSSEKSPQDHKMIDSKGIRMIVVASMILFFLQVAIGSQVREAIDVVAINLGMAARDLWITELGATFYVHRSFSLLLLGISLYLIIRIRRTAIQELIRPANFMLALVVFEVFLGVVLSYFSVPAWAQPLHLLTSLLILGVQYWIYLRLNLSAV